MTALDAFGVKASGTDDGTALASSAGKAGDAAADGGVDEFSLVDALEKASGVEVPNAVKEIRGAKILHARECDAGRMEETVKEILGMK